MNRKNTSHEEWPAELQKAIHAYPHIEASPDFNQRVLQALAQKQAQQSKLELFCDNLDRIFERPILKLLATSLFAILLAWGGANLISTFAFPNLSKQANSMTSHQINMQAQSVGSLTFGSGSLYAWESDSMIQPTSQGIISQPQNSTNSTDKKETSCSPNEITLWG